MSTNEQHPQLTAEEALQLMGLTEKAVEVQSFEELAEHVLPSITEIAHSCAALLYITDSQMHTHHFFQYGFPPEAASQIENLCVEQFELGFEHAESQPISVSASATRSMIDNLILYPLRNEETCIGLIGLVPQEDTASISSDLWGRTLHSITNAINRLAQHISVERQLANLNIYMTVSSMLAQSLDLHELLEATLYCTMDAASAEAASVLLLDDEKKNFSFYQVEGSAKLVLMSTTFPADKGLAGSVLQTQQSEIIDDVQNDARFYGKIDSEAGFQTKNMIVVPLVAGEERIGVLEVLNKVDNGSFTEEEQLLLLSIAEEIAFAIRNAKMFEYVANSYCKQRQGQGSCKGCSRPLGSWTPCIKYRDIAV